MTESTPAPEPADVDDSEFDPRAREALQKAQREAKNLRTRLHDTEARLRAVEDNRASDLARLAAAEKRDVEREAAQVLLDAEDLWRHTDEATQQAFVDEQFHEIIPDRVREAAAAIIAQRPHLAKPPAVTAPPTDRPLESLKPAARAVEPARETSWARLLRG